MRPLPRGRTRLTNSVMPFQLRDNIHWCVCAGRAVFLDLEADRYFCLPKEANDTFLRLATCNSSPADTGELQALLARELLIDVDGDGSVRTPPSIEAPLHDLLSEPFPRIRPIQLVRALACELRAAWLLRTRPLLEVLASAARHGSGERPMPQELDHSLPAIVAASNAIALVTRVHNRCLVRALALPALCKSRGIRPKLVFGVIAHPFAAHCWVQLGTAVLVGGAEQARLYTPILVIE